MIKLFILSFLYCCESGSSGYFLQVNRNFICILIYIVSDCMCILNSTVLVEIDVIE